MNPDSITPARPGLASWWGLTGVLFFLGSAVGRLWPHAMEPFQVGLAPWQWVVLGLWVIFMLYSEGYRGFQKRYSPRVISRAMTLAHQPRWYFALFAPLYCMGLFHATRRRLMIGWTFVAIIIALIVCVRQLPSPWRGIVDVGVVLGLTWGMGSIVVLLVQAMRGRYRLPSPELPEG